MPTIKFMDKIEPGKPAGGGGGHGHGHDHGGGGGMDQQMAQFQRRVEEQKRLERTLGRIKHKLVVMSGKGGVGKSTVAANLGMTLAKKGKKVGILDIDITGPNIPLMLGLEGQHLSGDDEGIRPVVGPSGVKVVSMEFLLKDPEHPIVWRGPIKMGAIRQFLTEVNWGELDFLVIDLPPGTSDEPLSVAQTIKDAEGAIIVTTPQDVAILDITKSINFAKMLNMKILGIVENMSGLVCPHCSKDIDLFRRGGGEAAAKRLGVPFLGSIPIDPQVVLCGDEGTPFVEVDPTGKVSEAFGAAVDSLLTQFES